MKIRYFIGFMLVAYIFTPLASKAQLLSFDELEKHPSYTSMEEALKEPGKVIVLNLSEPNESFYDNIGKLTKLQKLNLWKAGIEKLPESIGNLTDLQDLNLEDNHLSALPESFANLTNLKRLNLKNNDITELPVNFKDLKSLEVLNLAFNNLTEFPTVICKLANLFDLNLYHIKNIKTVPAEIAQMQSLVYLNINFNQISVIPDAICQLELLEELDMGNNPIKTIPSCISNLSNLTDIMLEKVNLPASEKLKLKNLSEEVEIDWGD